MFWVSKVLAPLSLVAGIAATTAVVMAEGDGNQPDKGGFDKGGFDKGGFGKGGFGGPGGFGKEGFGKEGFGKGGFGKGDEKKGDKGDKAPPGDKKGAPDKGGPGEKKGAPPAPTKADPQVEAWLAILLTKITDPHDTVRDSARGAVVAVGHEALPALQKLAAGDDSAKAVAARKLIAAIEGHGHTAPAPGAPGVPGKGPMMGGGGWGGWGGWQDFGPPGKGPAGPGGPKGGGRGEEDEPEVAPMPRETARR